MVKNKPVYAFEEADSKKRMLLGGKGAGLSEMTRLKLPVPPGFTITTEVCNKYYDNGRKLPKDVMPAVMKNIVKMEKKTGKKWNSTKNPLLVSVRSGAAISMPGMMDTILNLGLNEKTVEGFAVQTKNPRFSWDSYRRFIQLFGKVVFGVNDEKFDHVLETAKSKQGVTDDSKLNVESLKKIVREYKKICENHTKRKFPDTPNEQLGLAIEAVFKSWMGERAVVYREKNGITKDIANGTAVNVVTMVFGNMGDDSATGVVFTRNGHNGKREIEGEYLTNAQGEDVVAGVRTGKNVELLKKEMPKSHKELSNACEKLEKHFSRFFSWIILLFLGPDIFTLFLKSEVSEGKGGKNASARSKTGQPGRPTTAAPPCPSSPSRSRLRGPCKRFLWQFALRLSCSHTQGGRAVAARASIDRSSLYP